MEIQAQEIKRLHSVCRSKDNNIKIIVEELKEIKHTLDTIGNMAGSHVCKKIEILIKNAESIIG